MNQESTDQTSWALVFCSWLLATVASAGSLFFSEVMRLVPCELCWYQRIFMFPLVVVLLVGMFPLDKRVVNYALPLAVPGLLVTLYHCLVFFGLIPERLQPCRQGISCADDSMVLMGVVPIPLLSLAAFSIIITLLLIVRNRMNR